MSSKSNTLRTLVIDEATFRYRIGRRSASIFEPDGQRHIVSIHALDKWDAMFWDGKVAITPSRIREWIFTNILKREDPLANRPRVRTAAPKAPMIKVPPKTGYAMYRKACRCDEYEHTTELVGIYQDPKLAKDLETRWNRQMAAIVEQRYNINAPDSDGPRLRHWLLRKMDNDADIIVFQVREIPLDENPGDVTVMLERFKAEQQD